MARDIPAAAINLIKQFEGLRLKSYGDTGGVWTIGYGHTRGVRQGMTCTREQAEAWLIDDAREAAEIVEKAVAVRLNSNEFGALVSFVFNVGPGKAGSHSGFVVLKNGQPSTLLRVLNAGFYDRVPEQMLRWTHDNGQTLGGLVRRRNAEIRLWNESAETGV